MKTFNNDSKIKERLIKKLERHQELDAFVQGTWLTNERVKGKEFKGCFFGCVMQTEHKALLKFSKKYHIDLWLCRLAEKIYEGLSTKSSKTFPVDVIKAIPVGIDMDDLKSPWFFWLLGNQLQYCDNKKCIDAINKCINLFRVPFKQIDTKLARSAESSKSAAYKEMAKNLVVMLRELS